MSRLFKFEIKRMKYKKIHIILPLIIISIGLVGIITGNAFNENLTSKVKMLNIFHGMAKKDKSMHITKQQRNINMNINI